MIYLDTSVVLAHLLAEDRSPPDELWGRALVASRLLVYETWTRIHARGIASTHGDLVRAVLGRIAFIELVGPVLDRAREGFPAPMRTLDALHLTSLHFLRDQGAPVELASYDERLLEAARGTGVPIHPI